MAIIINDGRRLPTRRIDSVRFAADTPYETAFAVRPAEGEQVMAPEVAQALRGALSDVVESGTARRLAGAFTLADGTELVLGGKTGTGDNRIVVKGRAGLAMNRTATFVFYLGPRHFGTLTAYVIGPDAASYRFTSGLPVQILKSMGPLLLPHLETASADGCLPPPLSAGAPAAGPGAEGAAAGAAPAPAAGVQADEAGLTVRAVPEGATIEGEGAEDATNEGADGPIPDGEGAVGEGAAGRVRAGRITGVAIDAAVPPAGEPAPQPTPVE